LSIRSDRFQQRRCFTQTCQPCCISVVGDGWGDRGYRQKGDPLSNGADVVAQPAST
jgi:hypothetical protein